MFGKHICSTSSVLTIMPCLVLAGFGGVCGRFGEAWLYRLYPGLHGVHYAGEKSTTIPRCFSADSTEGNGANYTINYFFTLQITFSHYILHNDPFFNAVKCLSVFVCFRFCGDTLELN